MAKRFNEIGKPHRAFIKRQRIFFVAPAVGASRINISPRGTDGFRTIDQFEETYEYDNRPNTG